MSVTHLLPPFGAERPLCRSPREKQPRPSLPSGSPRLQRLLATALHNSSHILIDVLEVRLVPIPFLSLPPFSRPEKYRVSQKVFVRLTAIFKHWFRQPFHRSEERRVGKERRSRWSPDHYKN